MRRLLVALLALVHVCGCLRDPMPPVADSSEHLLEGYSRQFAIIVGINEYSELERLKYAVNDASAIRRILISDFGYTAERIRYLENPTTAELKDAFESWLPNKIWEAEEDQHVAYGTDAVLVFYAGHSGTSGSSTTYLAGIDSTNSRLEHDGLSVEWIVRHLKTLNQDLLNRSRGQRRLHQGIILDSCYSGYLFQQPPVYDAPIEAAESWARGSRSSERTTGSVYHRGISRHLNRPCFWGLSAARNTVAADSHGGNEHSYFTLALLQELKERCDSSAPEHAFTFRYLASRVQARMEAHPGLTQFPDSGRLTSDDGEFIFRQLADADVMTPSEVSRQRLENIRRGRYARDLANVSMTFPSDPTSAVAMLDDPSLFPPDLRDITWRLLRTRSVTPRQEVSAHTASIVAISSLVGDRLITCDATGVAKIWQLREGLLQEEREFSISANPPISAIAAASDGRFIAAGNGRGRITIYDVELAKRITSFAAHERSIMMLRFSRDSSLLASAALDNTPKLWRCSDWHVTHTSRHNALAPAVDVAADNSLLVTAGYDGLLALVTEAGEGWLQAASIEVGASIIDVRISQDGRTAAVATGHGIQMVDLETHRVTGRISQFLTPGRWVFAHNDPQTLVIATDERLIQCWNRNGGLDASFCAGTNVTCVTSGPRYVAAGCIDGTVVVWDELTDPSTPMVLPKLPASLTAFACNSTGDTVAFGTVDHRVYEWQHSTSAMPSLIFELDDYTTSLDYSLDGAYLAVGTVDGVLAIRQVHASDAVFETRLSVNSLSEVAFVHRTSSLLVAAEDGTVHTLSCENPARTRILRARGEPVLSLAISPTESQFALGMDDGSIELRTIESGNLRWKHAAHTELVWSLAFSPNSRLLATASQDGRAVIWDVSELREVTTLAGHAGAVLGVAFSPDGKTVATAGSDGTVRLWDPLSGHERLVLCRSDHAVEELAFAGGGRALFAAGPDHYVRFWQIEVPEPDLGTGEIQ